MPEQIYDKQQLRARVVAHLTKAGRAQTTGEVASALGVQLWAADRALEDAFQARQALFTAGLGWMAIPPAPANPITNKPAVDAAGGIKQ